MLKATVDQQKQYLINQKSKEIILNDESFNWNLSVLSPGHYHIIKGHQSYNLEVISHDIASKVSRLRINGAVHEVKIQDHTDLLLEKLGIKADASTGLQDLKAPMPGLVVDIFVHVGEEVSKGDKLLSLEAMKMENILKAQGDGTVKAVKVAKGDSVEKNQVMIQF